MIHMRNAIFSGLIFVAAGSLEGCGGGNPESFAKVGETTLAVSSTTSVWTQCAVEWKVCTFSGTAQVRYGLNGTYATKTATGSIACNNQVFGDPLPGADKVCEYSTDTTPPPPPPPPPPPTTSAWTQCAVEWKVCTFSGTAQVRYGLNGTYATKTATSSIACNNQVFGDPLPGADKVCEYSTDTTTPPPATGPMTMSCIDGSSTQCSGDSIIRIENGVALTRSGVQTYGKSTSDLRTPNPSAITARGIMLASGGMAEIRINKDVNGTASNPALLLSNLGLSWDGRTERPKIIETFRTTQGRVQQDASGTITVGALPASSNLGFYDFAIKGIAGTQLNYANNAYFPRSAASRCDVMPCNTVESTGPIYQAGNWPAGGNVPNQIQISRLHEDGDIHAGNGQPDANGNPTILEGGNGIGAPFPGSKGGRDLYNWSYQYGNLTAWDTQDTVQISEWGAAGEEHNKIRRGAVAFGQVSDPAVVPSSGSATYSGVAYGWYVPNTTTDVAFFRAPASVSVNFTNRTATITIQNGERVYAPAGAVPVTFNTTTTMGASGSNDANYLTGSVTGTLAGGLSGRYFGPVVTTGSSGAGPVEMGGSFSISNASTGQVAVGGFIARKQ